MVGGYHEWIRLLDHLVDLGEPFFAITGGTLHEGLQLPVGSAMMDLVAHQNPGATTRARDRFLTCQAGGPPSIGLI